MAKSTFHMEVARSRIVATLHSCHLTRNACNGFQHLTEYFPRVLFIIIYSAYIISSQNTTGPRPVDGGREADGTPLYIALGVVNGGRVPGKAGHHLGGASVAFGGSEIGSENAEILCVLCLGQCGLFADHPSSDAGAEALRPFRMSCYQPELSLCISTSAY